MISNSPLWAAWCKTVQPLVSCMLTSALFFNNSLMGSMFFSSLNDLTASSKAKVPYMVFLSLIFYPQESKKLSGFVSLRVDASQRSRIWLLARLCPAIFIISFLSYYFVFGTYLFRKFIILVDPFFDAIYKGVFWSLSLASKSYLIPFFNYV